MRLVISVLALGALAGVAQAGPWVPFQFGGTGSVSGPYSITTTALEPTLDVTDAFLIGDVFRIHVAGVGDFDTSAPDPSGTSLGGDYDACWADPHYSHGQINLGTGVFSFTIEVLASPFGAGGAAFRSGIPAPASVGLIGLAGLVAGRRRRV